jgi:hypothetical protein
MFLHLLIDNNPYPAGPESLPPTPRRVAWNNRARWLRTIAWAGLLFAPNIILLWARETGEDLRALDARGIHTLARIDDVRASTTKRVRYYNVRYTFAVAGTSYHGQRTAQASEFPNAAAGRQWPVTYLPDKPETNFPGRPGPELRKHNETAVFLALLATFGFAVWVACLEFTVRRERFLAREGEPAVGRIIARGETRSKNGVQYWVRHQFTSPGNDFLTDWHYVPRSLWETLRPGLAVTLLYDPERPGKHLPLYAFKYAYIVDDVQGEDAIGEPN